MKEPHWTLGVPPNPKAKPYAVMSTNGARFIINDGSSPNAFQLVVAHFELPELPKLKFNPRSFKDPHENWVGEYSAEYELKTPEQAEKEIMAQFGPEGVRALTL